MSLALARWWMVLVGGIILGGGLFLHGVQASAIYVREEAANTFFLWRWIGSITFPFQDDATQLALWLNEVPRSMIEESGRDAWTLIAIGCLLVLLSPCCKAKRKRARKHRRAT